jgi:hypothetical protein
MNIQLLFKALPDKGSSGPLPSLEKSRCLLLAVL